MLNYLWAGMTLTGILWGALHGQMTAVTDGAIQASKEAVTLCITMLGVMTLWTGVLEIGHRSGLVDQLAKRMGPVLTFLFPRLDPDGEARKQISVNMIANILGLGWAATPAGLKAMEELKRWRRDAGSQVRLRVVQRERAVRLRAVQRERAVQPGRRELPAMRCVRFSLSIYPHCSSYP